jgi:hypothetical protein
VLNGTFEVISCPSEHFDAIDFGARQVADFAVASGLEHVSYHFGSALGAGRICVTLLCTSFRNC